MSYGKYGQTTSLKFVSDYLEFNSDDYVLVQSLHNSEGKYTESELNNSNKDTFSFPLDESMELLKKNLLNRNSVPLMVHMLKATKDGVNAYKTTYDASICTQPGVECKDKESLHGLLAVDFVTIDSTGNPREGGELTIHDVNNIIYQQEALDSIIVKDDRGDLKGLTQTGAEGDLQDDFTLGYKRLKYNYLDEIVHGGNYTPKQTEEGADNVLFAMIIPRSSFLLTYDELLTNFVSRYEEQKLKTQVRARISLGKFANNTYYPGQQMRISTSMSLYGTYVDVYVVLKAPSKDVFTLVKQGADIVFSAPNEVKPLQQGVTFDTLGAADPLFSNMLPPDVPGGIYDWYIILTKPGQNVLSEGNWITYDKVSFKIDNKNQ